jgi:hypothetical protein
MVDEGEDLQKFENVSPQELQEMIDEGEIAREDLDVPPGSGEKPNTPGKDSNKDLRKSQDQSGVEDDEYSFTIDVSKYPSQGLVYDFDTIRARGALVSELKYLDLMSTGGDFTEFHSNLFKFLQSATSIDITNMTYGDEMPLFIEIRANTYPNGDKYPIEFDCRNQDCGKPNKINFPLEQLEFDELDESYEEPKEYEIDGSVLKLSVLRQGDILDIESLISKFAQGEILSDYDFNLKTLYKTATKASSIKGIDGVNISEQWRNVHKDERINEIVKRIKLIEDDQLSFNQFKALEAFEEKYSHDIDLNITVECQFCGEEQETVLPMNREFFYPQDQGVTQDNLSDFEV